MEEEGVESIIQMVEIRGLQPFFEELSKLFGKELPLPPAHVTLYTMGNPKGIGLPTQAVFDRLVKRELELEELHHEG